MELPQDEDGSEASLLNDIGRAHLLRGELDEAMSHFRRAARQPSLVRGEATSQFAKAARVEAATALGHIGGVLHMRGDAATALEHYRRVLRTQEQLLSAEHPDAIVT